MFLVLAKDIRKETNEILQWHCGPIDRTGSRKEDSCSQVLKCVYGHQWLKILKAYPTE